MTARAISNSICERCRYNMIPIIAEDNLCDACHIFVWDIKHGIVKEQWNELKQKLEKEDKK